MDEDPIQQPESDSDEEDEQGGEDNVSVKTSADGDEPEAWY